MIERLKKWWDELFNQPHHYIPGNDWQDHACGEHCPKMHNIAPGEFVCDEHDRILRLLADRAVHRIGGEVCFLYEDKDQVFTCPKCNKKSWHPEDKKQGYCGACKEFTGGVD